MTNSYHIRLIYVIDIYSSSSFLQAEYSDILLI